MYSFMCTGDHDCTGLVLLLLGAAVLSALAWASLFVVPAALAAPALSPHARRPRRRWAAAGLLAAVVGGAITLAAETGPLVVVLWWVALAVWWRRTAP